MLRIPLIYIKDKQAFVKEGGVLRLLGNPIVVAHRLKEKGFVLLHIIDIDGKRGIDINFDIYDKLTYFIHIQVECGENERLIKKLLDINARVVIELPPKKIELKKLEKRKKLLVGKPSPAYKGKGSGVHDMIVSRKEDLSRFKDKRIIFSPYYRGKEKGWGRIILPKL